MWNMSTSVGVPPLEGLPGSLSFGNETGLVLVFKR
jgi:hypothetical protein